MTTSASLCEGPIFYLFAFTFLLSQSIPILPLSWQASCGEERSRHIYPAEYEWAWIIIVDLTLKVNMLGSKYKPLSFFVSGWSFLCMGKPWVLAIMKGWMMVEYVDLLKSSYVWLFLKVMMNCSCKIDWEHSLLVSNEVYASYFNVVMNCYLFMRSIWWKSYEKSFMIRFPCCYNNEHDASMSVSCFYRLLSLKACGHVCSILVFAWGQARSKLGGADTSILHHVYLLLFIMFSCKIKPFGVILIPFLS